MTPEERKIDELFKDKHKLESVSSMGCDFEYYQKECNCWVAEAKASLLQMLDLARADELKAPNDLLRSMYQIACREYALDGENTNWSPFINKLSDELEREHKIMYPERYTSAQLNPKEKES